MIASQLKELATARAKLAQLELTVETELRRELSSLHERYGFSDLASFLQAVKSAARGNEKGNGRTAGRPAKKAAVKVTRKRAVITAATRAQVKKLVKAGKSGSQIAKTVGISLPSVQNIKKALGLVKARGLNAKQAPAKKKLVTKTPAKRRSVRKASVKNAPAAPLAPAPAAPPGE